MLLPHHADCLLYFYQSFVDSILHDNISLKIIESEGCQCSKLLQKKSQKRHAADAAEEAAAAAAAEAKLMEREEEEENEISFHILCFHGKFLPPIFCSVVTLVVMALCTSSCARQIQLRRSK